MSSAKAFKCCCRQRDMTNTPIVVISRRDESSSFLVLHRAHMPTKDVASCHTHDPDTCCFSALIKENDGGGAAQLQLREVTSQASTDTELPLDFLAATVLDIKRTQQVIRTLWTLLPLSAEVKTPCSVLCCVVLCCVVLCCAVLCCACSWSCVCHPGGARQSVTLVVLASRTAEPRETHSQTPSRNRPRAQCIVV